MQNAKKPSTKGRVSRTVIKAAVHSSPRAKQPQRGIASRPKRNAALSASIPIPTAGSIVFHLIRRKIPAEKADRQSVVSSSNIRSRFLSDSRRAQVKISFSPPPAVPAQWQGKAGGGGIGALAGDPSQAVSNIAGSHTLCQIGNTLSVAGAAADKFQVVNITVHQIKGDFLRANALRRPCAICAIGPHNPVIHIALIFCSIMRCCRL